MTSRIIAAFALSLFAACASRAEPDGSTDVLADASDTPDGFDVANPPMDVRADDAEQTFDVPERADVPIGRDASDVVPVLPPLSPGYCRTNLDCASGSFCSTRDGVCLQCGDDSECPPGERCLGNSCVGSCADSGTCPAGQACCGDVCVDLQTNPEHCGTCDRACPFRCVAGECPTLCTGLCGAGLTCCASVCRDLQRDNGSCGRCGIPCEGAQTCIDGRCQEAVCSPACAPDESCCGSRCVNLRTDPTDCGACDLACPRGDTCVDGTCTPTTCGSGPACSAGQSCCWGTCLDVTSDVNNCGSCAHACSAGAMCVGGLCRIPVPPGSMYSHDRIDQPFIDACAATGGATVLPATDDAATRIGLPFPFTLWGHAVSNPWINSNGVLEFTTLPSSLAANTCLGSGPASYQSIYAFWDDLRTRSGICIATLGAPGSRSFVVEWNDATFASTANAHLTFEIVLHEGTNLIDLIFSTMTGDPSDAARATGTSATIGITGGVGSVDSIGCNAGVVTAPVAYRFTPL